MAQRTVEDNIERKVSAKMAERHQDYLKDLKLEALREDCGPETPATQEKLDELGARSNGAGSRPRRSRSSVPQASKRSSAKRPRSGRCWPRSVVAVPAARHPLRAARRRQDDGRAARRSKSPRSARYTPFPADAPFVEASGTTLRWDPRETTNPLLGSVHDPIYQGSRREFAEGGIPEPKLGLVTKAHGGVLFIDEIGEMDAGAAERKLLKVLEDKRVQFESSYYDEQRSERAGVRASKLFADGAPADFILIGATTREPEEIDPAIRSRCARNVLSAADAGADRRDRAGRGRRGWAQGAARRRRS